MNACVELGERDWTTRLRVGPRERDGRDTDVDVL